MAVTLTALVLVASGCGDDDPSSDSGDDSSESRSRQHRRRDCSGDRHQGDAHGRGVLRDLDPTVQEAFRRASIELTDEQLDKAFECWSETTCEIGDGDTTLGIAEAYGQNQWRKISKMEVILQALTYPEIGKIIFTDAR